MARAAIIKRILGFALFVGVLLPIASWAEPPTKAQKIPISTDSTVDTRSLPSGGGLETKLPAVLKDKVLYPMIPNNALPFQEGSLYVPVRTRSAVAAIPGMTCKDMNPIGANFVTLEDRTSTFYSIRSLQCQIDPQVVTIRASAEDLNDSAYECFANASYCDAMWVDAAQNKASFLKFP